jgi:syntaxin 1B/2/3
VLGAVRARHNDIVQIEKTIGELALLFRQLDEVVTYQDTAIQQTEQQTEQVKTDTEQANTHLDKGIVSARRARRLKWWCLLIVVIIIAIIAIVLGVYFGVIRKSTK